MNHKWSRILFVTIAMLTLLSIAATAHRYLVLRDYEVYDDTEEELEEEYEEYEI